MPLAIDSQEAGSSGNTAVSSPLTWSFTNTAGTLIVVGVVVAELSAGTPAAAAVSAVSYGGSSCTQIGTSAEFGSANGLATDVSLWYRKSPATGSNTVSVTCSWGHSTATVTERTVIAGAISYSGEDPTTYLGSPFKSTGSGTTATVTVTGTVAGNQVVACAAAGSSWGTPITPSTKSWMLNVTNNFSGGNGISVRRDAPGGNAAIGSSISGSDSWGICAVEVLAAASTGGAAARTPTRSLFGVGL